MEPGLFGGSRTAEWLIHPIDLQIYFEFIEFNLCL